MINFTYISTIHNQIFIKICIFFQCDISRIVTIREYYHCNIPEIKPYKHRYQSRGMQLHHHLYKVPTIRNFMRIWLNSSKFTVAFIVKWYCSLKCQIKNEFIICISNLFIIVFYFFIFFNKNKDFQTIKLHY